LNSDSKYISLILIHVVIGFLIYALKPLSKFYFFTALIFFVGSVVVAHKSKKTTAIMNACAYFIGAEVFFRMTKGGMSYEASKYLVIFFVVLGMVYKGISDRGYPYFVYLILLVPSIVIASLDLNIDANFRTNLAFVLSGPVCLGLAALFFFERKVKHKDIVNMLAYMSMPIVTMTTYLMVFNPSVKETIKNTASNYVSSGGFGPNQVSTILGLGVFVFTVRLLIKSPTIFLKLFNSFFLVLIAYRAIITFSRGGVLAAIITIVAFVVIFYAKALPRVKTKIIGSVLVLFMAMIASWFISSSNTLGLIDKRYANQDSLGREKADFTTGRVELVFNELDGFIENPFFGIGASNTKYNREGKEVVTHNELTRLLSEHGVFGIFILLILIFTPLSYRSENRKNVFFYAFLAFWFATINHSAMRIAAPAFFYALALLDIEYEKHPIRRKRLVAKR
jgi:hypothetical protein